MGQFAEFHSSLRQNCPNSATYHGFPVCKPSFILSKNFIFEGQHGAQLY